MISGPCFEPDPFKEVSGPSSAGKRPKTETPKLGPETPLDRRGSPCSTGCTQNEPRRLILRPLCVQTKFEFILPAKALVRLDFSFSVPYIRTPELVFVDLCSVFQAGAGGHGPGPNFGRKPTNNLEKQKYIFQFPVLSPSRPPRLE